MQVLLTGPGNGPGFFDTIAVPMRLFVAISGLPASGKTTLGLQLAAALDLPLIDKDTILDSLFNSQGVGDSEWRRALSRQADALFQIQAVNSGGAVLVSHWRLPGMPPESGTDTAWLLELPGTLVHVQCICPVPLAARRFLDRRRHPGHLDASRSYAEILRSFDALASLGPLGVVPRIDVETSEPRWVEPLVQRIRAAVTPSGCSVPPTPL